MFSIFSIYALNMARGAKLLYFYVNRMYYLMHIFCICYRYFQALVTNMSFVKYKEVYAAAAEVLGLILQYVTKKENVSVLYNFK